MNKRTLEILRFAVTGAVCFLVEFVILVILKSALHLDTLIATPLAFIVAVIVNYILCLKWVFESASDGGNKTRFTFFMTSVVGLLLNEILMYVFRLIFGEDTVLFTVFGFAFSMYMMNKVLATLLVMIWNYISKRAVLNKKPG